MFNLFVQNSFSPSLHKIHFISIILKKKTDNGDFIEGNDKDVYHIYPPTNLKLINKYTFPLSDPRSRLLTTLLLSNGMIKRCSRNYQPD